MQDLQTCDEVNGVLKNCVPNGRSRECNTQPCSYWSEWGDWGDCSVTCLTGIHSRQRTCLGGDECVGDEEEFEECDSGVPGCWAWTEWAPWSDCSATCAEGEKTTTRMCIADGYPAEATKGLCPGEETKSERCNVEGQFYRCPRKF